MEVIHSADRFHHAVKLAIAVDPKSTHADVLFEYRTEQLSCGFIAALKQSFCQQLEQLAMNELIKTGSKHNRQSSVQHNLESF
jgi:hypothetical protein